jgi:chaperonin GroES
MIMSNNSTVRARYSILLTTLLVLAVAVPNVAFAWTSRATQTIAVGAANQRQLSTRATHLFLTDVKNNDNNNDNTMIAEAVTLPSTTTTSITLDGQEIRGPIAPVGNILVVRVKDTLSSTGGGILLPDQSKLRPTEGLVVAAGPGRIHPHTGVLITNPITEGMSVV